VRCSTLITGETKHSEASGVCSRASSQLVFMGYGYKESLYLGWEDSTVMHQKSSMSEILFSLRQIQTAGFIMQVYIKVGFKSGLESRWITHSDSITIQILAFIFLKRGGFFCAYFKGATFISSKGYVIGDDVERSSRCWRYFDTWKLTSKCQRLSSNYGEREKGGIDWMVQEYFVKLDPRRLIMEFKSL